MYVLRMALLRDVKLGWGMISRVVLEKDFSCVGKRILFLGGLLCQVTDERKKPVICPSLIVY